MFNPYSIVLILFVLLGLGASIWGWMILLKSRESLKWPKVRGTIIASELTSEQDDLLPHIAYRYELNDQTFEAQLDFPADLTPSHEFSQQYAQKYPVGKPVDVYYHPQQAQRSTLEPGLARGDWLVLALGLGSAILGTLLLIFH